MENDTDMVKACVDGIMEGIYTWAEREKKHNPSFSLVVGRKSYTIDQIVQHIEKQTPDGKELFKKITRTATDLFLSGR